MFALVFQGVKKPFFILFLLQCFVVVVLCCFHLKRDHPNSVRTRKPNNSLRIYSEKEKAKPTGESSRRPQGAREAEQTHGVQTALGLARDTDLGPQEMSLACGHKRWTCLEWGGWLRPSLQPEACSSLLLCVYHWLSSGHYLQRADTKTPRRHQPCPFISCPSHCALSDPGQLALCNGHLKSWIKIRGSPEQGATCDLDGGEKVVHTTVHH